MERSCANEDSKYNLGVVSCCAVVVQCCDSIDLVVADNQIIMVFNGAEAFKGGASAPSLEREVSGE